MAWMAARLVSSKSETRYASADSWSAMTADDWKRRSVLKSCAISRTRRWKLGSETSSSAQIAIKRNRKHARELADEELGRLLVATDLPERDGSRSVAVGVKDRSA